MTCTELNIAEEYYFVNQFKHACFSDNHCNNNNVDDDNDNDVNDYDHNELTIINTIPVKMMMTIKQISNY